MFNLRLIEVAVMMIESKPEKPVDSPERKAAPVEAVMAKPEEYPFYIVPAPPIPGQTGWSIVPW
jgi:hypothetical protein